MLKTYLAENNLFIDLDQCRRFSASRPEHARRLPLVEAECHKVLMSRYGGRAMSSRFLYTAAPGGVVLVDEIKTVSSVPMDSPVCIDDSLELAGAR